MCPKTEMDEGICLVPLLELLLQNRNGNIISERLFLTPNPNFLKLGTQMAHLVLIRFLFEPKIRARTVSQLVKTAVSNQQFIKITRTCQHHLLLNPTSKLTLNITKILLASNKKH